MTCSEEERLKAWRKRLPVPDTAPAFHIALKDWGQCRGPGRGVLQRRLKEEDSFGSYKEKRQDTLGWPGRVGVVEVVFKGVALHQLSEQQTLAIVTSWKEHTSVQIQRASAFSIFSNNILPFSHMYGCKNKQTNK